MQPLGKMILISDIGEKEKKTQAGIILQEINPYKKVKIEALSETTATSLQPGDICLSNPGGVELEKGIWLCDEGLLVCKL